MSDEVGFVTMAGQTAAGEAPEIGIGMLGYAFMGKAHSNAFKKLPYMVYPPPAIPTLIAIAGRNESAVKDAAQRYGYDRLLHRLEANASRRPDSAIRQRRSDRRSRRAMHRRRPERKARLV